MKAVIYKFAYPFLKIYWFIFRPKTQGVQCLILSGDQLLLIRHTYGHSAWTLSGGGIKKGETKEEAVKREVKEELGLESHLNIVENLLITQNTKLLRFIVLS
jgi:ADP-ribose pyrophosphatase YjhB (NUDIX family)